jgi:hypothetical protein
VTACFLLALFAAGTGSAQMVRGRVDRVVPGLTYPAPQVMAWLDSPTWGRSAPSYTDLDGMYYFYNVRPGPYMLSVAAPWGASRSVSILVHPQPWTDIPPLPIN